MRTRKNNSRRFFRHDAEVSFYPFRVSGKKREGSSELANTGLCFYSTKVLGSAHYSRLSLLNTLKSISKQHPEAKMPFMETLAKIDFLRKYTYWIQEGQNPILSKDYLEGIEVVMRPAMRLEESKSKKARSFLMEIDEKALSMIRTFHKALSRSNENYIDSIEGERVFKIDQSVIKIRDIYVRTKSEFSRSFLELYEYMDLINKVMIDVFDVYWKRDRPDQWEKQLVNLSCGGARFKTQYQFEEGDEIDFYVRFPVPEGCSVNKEFQAKIRSKVIYSIDLYKGYGVAIQFHLVEQKVMRAIGGYINQIEVKDFIKKEKEIDKG